jgi:hypothetical protein
VLVNGKGGVYGYGGVHSDIAFDRIVVTPLAAVGAYRRGDGADLGGTLEFRLSIAAAYELDHKSRLGLQIAHLSNGGLIPSQPRRQRSARHLQLSLAPAVLRGLASFALPPTGCAGA